MLVIVWETMNAAIPRLQAEDNLSAYSVAVLATPTADRYAASDRERILESWQRLASPVRRSIELSVEKLKEVLQGAFGGQIRS